MMRISFRRWLYFVCVFIVLAGLWASLAAAANLQEDIKALANPTPIPGLLEPGNPTFALIIGAIVIVTIVITSSILRLQRER